MISYTGSETFGMLVMSLGSLASLAGMAGLVMMIILRVQYPKNTIGKVLMWLYIISLILTILGVLLLIAFCNAIVYSCQGIY